MVLYFFSFLAIVRGETKNVRHLIGFHSSVWDNFITTECSLQNTFFHEFMFFPTFLVIILLKYCQKEAVLNWSEIYCMYLVSVNDGGVG